MVEETIVIPFKCDDGDTRFHLESNNVEVILSAFGATIVSLKLPDKNGNVEDCVLGFDSMAKYDRIRDENPCFGSTIGRVANRTANAQFTLNGETTKLAVNCGDKHHLHGGDRGFHR